MSGLLLWAGDHLFWFSSNRSAPESFQIASDPSKVVAFLDAPDFPALPSELQREIKAAGRAAGFDSVSRSVLERALPEATRETPANVRMARGRIPPQRWVGLRPLVLRFAEARLRSALSSPTEVLTSLAREEERVERAVVRETGAADQWVTGSAPSLVEYERDWEQHRRGLEDYHVRLLNRLESVSRRHAPNLSAVVGPRVAARLIAAAGGIEPLARMSAGRLQLLGTRRRPGPGKGPRFGIIVRAEGMGAIPPDRQAAFARSLAALAVVAARADALTRRDLAETLQLRKDRRSQSLRRGRHP